MPRLSRFLQPQCYTGYGYSNTTVIRRRLSVSLYVTIVRVRVQVIPSLRGEFATETGATAAADEVYPFSAFVCLEVPLITPTGLTASCVRTLFYSELMTLWMSQKWSLTLPPR